MSGPLQLIVVLAIFPVFPAAAAEDVREAGKARIWAESGAVRVPVAGAKPGMDRAQVKAARGEVEGFQVVVQIPREELKGARAGMQGLENARSGGALSFRIYRQHPVRVVESTERALLPPGFYYDALVEVRDGRLDPGAWSAGDRGVVQLAFWIDVEIDRAYPPGNHEAAFVFESGAGRRFELPVEIEVWDFELPRFPKMKTAFGISREHLERHYGYERGSFAYNRLRRSFEDLLAAHRISPEGLNGTELAISEPSRGFDVSGVEAPGLGTPEEIYRHFSEVRPVSTLILRFWPDWPFEDPLGRDREAARVFLAEQVRWLFAQGYGDRLVAGCGYVDEPSTREGYERVRAWGRFFDEVEALAGHPLPMFVTEQPTPDAWRFGSLAGAVDIWVVHVSDLWRDQQGAGQSEVVARQREGDEIWLYTAMVQTPGGWLRKRGHPERLEAGNPPAWILDFPPLNHRMTAWIAWVHGITGQLYWDSFDWRQEIDPWERADTQLIDGRVYNGDGLLIYPGCVRTSGRDEPVPSLRLKWIRESMDDYDYLHLATEVVGREAVMARVRMICRDVGDWDNGPAQLLAIRAGIGRLLSSGNTSDES